MLRKLTPWLFLLVALAGCGSSQDFVATTNPSRTVPQGSYYAQVYLDSIDTSSQLEIEANGRTLATIPPGNGTFKLPSGLPNKFTLVARSPVRPQSAAAGFELRRNVDLSDPTQRRFIVINAVSNLAALLQELDPSLGVAQAQARVRTGLAIPPTIPTTDMLSSRPGSPFSHREFLKQASLNGGVDAFSRQVAQDIANGETRAFTEPTLQLGVDAGEAILGGLLGNVCATPFTLVETQAIGWAAGKMGFQNSTEQQLDSIANQLNELSAQITALSNQLALQGVSSQYTEDQTNLSGFYGPALNQTYGPPNSSSNNTTGLVPNINAQAPSYATVSNLGPQVPSVAQNLLAGFNTLNTPDAIEQVCGYLLGRNSPYTATIGNDDVVTTYNSFANASYLGDTTSAGEVFNYTSRSDQSTQAYFLPNLQYYSQLLIVLANLDVETAHASTLPQTASGYAPPAASFNRAQRDLYTVGQAYQLAQQQVPEAINYPVYVDIGNRLLWSPDQLSQTYDGIDQANEAMEGYLVGPFEGGWSMASSTQMQSLYNKALAIAGGNNEYVPEAYTRLLGMGDSPPPTQYFYVSDSGDAWDAYQGQLVTTRDLPNGRAGSAFVRTIPNGLYGDSPYITVFNYGLTIDQPLTVTQNGNQMTANLPAYTSNFPTNQDITNLVSWTSSDTSVVDVSNVASPSGATNTLTPGQLIFHGPGTATITATVIQGEGTLSGSATVTSTVTPTLNGVLLSPQNVLYNLLPQPSGTGGFGQQFYLTGFQTDLTAVDLTQSPNTTYALYQLPDATPIDPTTVNVSGLTPVPSSVASFNSTGAGFLTINATGGVSPFSNGNLLVVATYTDPATGTVTQQSSQIVMPVSSSPPPPPPNTSAPTIASVTPSSGTNAGGTAVTIRGKNFTGATSVTIAGRTAQFGVNSSSELTVNTPSYTGTGFVSLVITTPNGAATTTFDYTD